MPANQLPQATRDALTRQDASFLARGLILNDPRSSEAHLRRTARLLGDRQAPSPCGRAVTHVTELFEKTVTAQQKAMLACRTGCSLCCHQPVAVSAPEAFYLAAVLQLRPDVLAAMEEKAAHSRNSDPAGTKASWFACPLLDEAGACSAYRARPIACHAFVSTNVEDCRDAFGPNATRRIMEPLGMSDLKDHCRVMLLAAMRVHGLPPLFYEMNAAVSTVMKLPHAEKRWLRGENVFGDLPTITPLAPQPARVVEMLAQNIAPTL